MYCAEIASGNVRFSESRMEARKSAIHRLAHATQSSLDGNAAVAHIRRVAQATQDPLRLLVGRDGAAEVAVNAQPAMLWTAADALERVDRDAEERKQKKLHEERKRVERARTTEENKRKRAEHQARVEQRKQVRAVKKAARDAEKDAKRLAREAAGLPARGAARKKATTPGASGDEASDGNEDAELEASMAPPPRRQRKSRFTVAALFADELDSDGEQRDLSPGDLVAGAELCTGPPQPSAAQLSPAPPAHSKRCPSSQCGRSGRCGLVDVTNVQ